MFIEDRRGHLLSSLLFLPIPLRQGLPWPHVFSGGWKIRSPVGAGVTGKCRIPSLLCRCSYLKQ